MWVCLAERSVEVLETETSLTDGELWASLVLVDFSLSARCCQTLIESNVFPSTSCD